MRFSRTPGTVPAGGGSPRPRSAKRLRLVAAVALALALTAAGCGAEDSPAAQSSAQSGNGGPVLASSVLQGEARTIDGGSFELASLQNKDLVVWFWAPW